MGTNMREKGLGGGEWDLKKSITFMMERLYGRTEYILQYMDEELECPSTQRLGCQAIASIAQSSSREVNNAEKLAEATIRAMKKFSHDQDVQVEGVRAISHLKMEPREDILAVIFFAMSSHRKEARVIAHSIAALTHILSRYRQRTAEWIRKREMVSALVEMFREHPNSLELQRESAHMVFQLTCEKDAELHRMLVREGGHELLLRALQSFPNDAQVVENALGALQNLTAFGASSEVKQLVVEQGVPEAIKLASHHRWRIGIAEKCCGIIANCATHLGSTDVDVELSVVRLLQDWIRWESMVELATLALKSISMFVQEEDSRPCMEILQSEKVNALLHAAQVHPTHGNIQLFCVWTLNNTLLGCVDPHETKRRLSENKEILGCAKHALALAHQSGDLQLRAEAQGLLDFLLL